MKHIVGFSGGVDSQAALLWVRNRFPAKEIIALNTDAGRNELQITVDFVAEFSAKVFPVVQVKAIPADLNTPPFTTDGWAERRAIEFGYGDELTFEGLMRSKNRAPSPKARFCTSVLKLMPMRRWTLANVGDDYERYTGVRRDESPSRRNAPMRVWDEVFDCWQNNPLADWTKKMCFDYVTAHGEKFNPLYTLGFNRVGCGPCIDWGKDSILAWAERFPEAVQKVRGYEKASGKTFFAPMVPGMVLNFVDDVVAWAKTSFGGQQFRILPERPSCESKYGLCE